MPSKSGPPSRSSGSGGKGSGGTGRPSGPGGKPGRPGGRPPGSGEGRPGGKGRPSSPANRGQGGRPGSGPRRDDREDGPRTAGPKGWGSLGRRGAGRLSDTEEDRRNAIGATGRDERPDPGNEKVHWERVDDPRKEDSKAVGRGRGEAPADGLAPKERRGRPARKPGAGSAGAEARDELVRALGAQKGDRANARLRDAAHAFERERFEESRVLLKPIAEQAPQAATVRELLGLTYYRLGRWKDSVRELEAFREITGSTEQNPVLADSYRALKRWREVEDLWVELKESSPAADLVTEGRIVMAGSLADRGKLAEAIDLISKSQRGVKRPGVHHLRQAYVLADLYERAGEIARARELFKWVVDHDSSFADAAERAASLA
ncbi:MAG: hypothetical protein ABI239_08620 [Aquihabitans sp.]